MQAKQLILSFRWDIVWQMPASLAAMLVYNGLSDYLSDKWTKWSQIKNLITKD